MWHTPTSPTFPQIPPGGRRRRVHRVAVQRPADPDARPLGRDQGLAGRVHNRPEDPRRRREARHGGEYTSLSMYTLWGVRLVVMFCEAFLTCSTGRWADIAAIV